MDNIICERYSWRDMYGRYYRDVSSLYVRVWNQISDLSHDHRLDYIKGCHMYIWDRWWAILTLCIKYPELTFLMLLGTGFSQLYPGIRPHLLTLTSNFLVPIYRDILLAIGICSVSKQSCSNILKGGPGQAITIVVGGAAESLSARPGTADLTLRKRWVWTEVYRFPWILNFGWDRLGFIKVAIQHG